MARKIFEGAPVAGFVAFNHAPSDKRGYLHSHGQSGGILNALEIEGGKRNSDALAGDIETRFTKDELLTQIMIYWATESIGPSFLTYYDFANAGALTWIKKGMKNWIGSSKVPAAFALFPADISRPPREWAERFFNVQRWTEMPRGGHFAAMEEPVLLAEDIRTWFRPFRAQIKP
jgi:pimeloyl-ACP methyl ester carboxylesterase